MGGGHLGYFIIGGWIMLNGSFNKTGFEAVAWMQLMWDRGM
jgi:hypothetical protein